MAWFCIFSAGNLHAFARIKMQDSGTIGELQLLSTQRCRAGARLSPGGSCVQISLSYAACWITWEQFLSHTQPHNLAGWLWEWNRKRILLRAFSLSAWNRRDVRNSLVLVQVQVTRSCRILCEYPTGKPLAQLTVSMPPSKPNSARFALKIRPVDFQSISANLKPQHVWQTTAYTQAFKTRCWEGQEIKTLARGAQLPSVNFSFVSSVDHWVDFCPSYWSSWRKKPTYVVTLHHSYFLILINHLFLFCC